VIQAKEKMNCLKSCMKGQRRTARSIAVPNFDGIIPSLNVDVQAPQAEVAPRICGERLHSRGLKHKRVYLPWGVVLIGCLSRGGNR